MDKKADWNDHQDLDAAGGPWAVVASWCCTAGDMGGLPQACVGAAHNTRGRARLKLRDGMGGMGCKRERLNTGAYLYTTLK